MPGDINTYALGIEFNLNATKAVSALKDIHQQAMDVQKAFSKDVQIKVDTAPMEQQNQFVEQQAQLTREVDSAFAANKATIEDLKTTLGGAAKDAEAYKTIMSEFGPSLTSMKRGLEQLEDAGLKGTAVHRQLKQQIWETEDAIGEYKNSVDEATEAWKRQQELASQAMDRMVGMVSKISPGLGGAIKSVMDVGGAFSDAKESAAAMQAVSADSTTGASLGDTGSKAVEMAEGLDTAKTASAAMSKTMSKGSKAAAGGIAKTGAAAGGMGGAMAKANPYILAASVALDAVLAVSDALGSSLEKMGMSATASGRAIAEGIKTLNPFKMMISFVTGAIEEFIQMEEKLSGVTYRAMGSIDQTTAAVENLRKDLSLTNEEATETIAAMTETGITMVATRGEIAALSKTTAKFSIATGVATKTTANFVKHMTISGKSTKQVHSLLGSYATAMKKAGIAVEEMTAILEEAIALTPKLRALFGPKSVETFTTGLVNLTAQMKKLGYSAKEASEIMTATNDVWGDTAVMADILGKGIDDPIDRAMALGESYGSLREEWAKMDPEARALEAEIWGMSAAAMGAQIQAINAAGGVEEWGEQLRKTNEEQKKTDALNEAFRDKLSTLSQELKRLAEEFMPILTEAIKELKPHIVSAMKGIKPLIQDIIKWMPDIIKGFESFFGVLQTVFKVGRVVWALFSGFLQGVWDAFEPLVELWGTFIDVIGEVFGLFGDGSKDSTGGMETLLSVVKGFGRVMGWLGSIIVLPFTLMMRAIKWVSEKVGDLIHLMFGSSFLHIEEGIAVIMKPLTWLKDAFVWVWEKVKSLSGTVGNFLGSVIPKGVDVAKKAVNVLLAPFKAVGKAVGWVKKKLFGSSMLHLKEGAAAVSPSIKSLSKDFMNLGASASTQGLKTSKYYAQAMRDIEGFAHFSKKQQATILKTYESPGGRALAAVQGQAMQAGRLANEGSWQKMRRSLGFGEPIRREMDQEMGRTSKEAEQIKIMNMTLAKIGMGIIKIAEMLEDSGKSPQEIVDLLKEYLPQVAERPAELGPAVSMW